MKINKSIINLFVVSLSFGLFACTNPSEHKEHDPIEPKEPTPIAIDITDQEVYEFGQRLLARIQADEQMLVDAFSIKDVKRIENYNLYEWQDYINKPYGPEEEKMGFGHRYFPSSAKASIYTVCDTAFGDLNLLAGAMVHVLEDPANGSFQKIYKQEFEDYSKSKVECQERVNLSFGDAVKAYENE